MKEIAIPRGPLTLSAHLHLPADLDGPGAAVVLATPGSSVKEQIGDTYARRLAERGLIALTFDPAFQGASGGEPRDLEDPAERVADLRHAVDLLQAHEHVDPDRIGVLGVCAGGAYAVRAATTDHRLRAVGLVVPSDIGRAFREFAGDPAAALDAAARRDGPERVPWLPDTVADAEAAGITDVDLLQAVRFYRTPRGQHPRSTNRRHRLSDPLLIGFDAFHLADQLLTQPLQAVVAGEAGSTGSTADGYLISSLAPAAEEPIEIEGARHYELYDEPAYVDEAVTHLHRFLTAHLAA